MEKRKFQRIAINNLTVNVSDGIGVFPGMISDVSKFGIGMHDLSRKLHGDVKKMTVVISGPKVHYKMDVKPKWSVKDSLRESVGAEILNAPWSWTEFIKQFEPEIEDDVWGLNPQ
jgi:hypothetical protein